MKLAYITAVAGASLLAGPLLSQDLDGKATSQKTAKKKDRGLRILQANSSQNMTLLRKWTRTSGGYNDIWGWTAPDGREFAYVGERSGIWFLETTDPKNIKQIGWWSAPTSTWRDFTNVDHYVYSVSEHHRGIRIFDMSNPSSPKDLGYVHTSAIRNTHNISVDPETKHLYLSGTNQGLMIYDASQNPTNPTYVGRWRTSYTHDACIRRGRAYLSNGRSYQCRIMSTANPASLQQIGTCPTPGGYDHNVWVTPDDNLLCVTDEISRGSNTPHMTVWDITNPASPVQRGDYDLGSNSIVHNVFIIGRTAYMSHYVDGLHVVDLADPTNPTMVAYYDTSTKSSGYNGAWGVYPFADSGVIYVSDIQNGFYAFQMDNGHMNRFGAGTPGTGKVVPRASFDGATPRVGASKLTIDVENMQPNAQGAILVSGGQAQSTLLGANIHVDLTNFIMVYFKADAQGRASLPAPVPANAGLANTKIYMQILAVDPGAPQGIASSRGMWAGIAQ